jgi:hypothetical protein
MVCGSCHSNVIGDSHESTGSHVSSYSTRLAGFWTDSVRSYRSSRRNRAQHIVLSLPTEAGAAFYNAAQAKKAGHLARLFLWCAEHVRQLGGESPLLILMASSFSTTLSSLNTVFSVKYDFDTLTWPHSILRFGPTLLKAVYRVLRFGLSRPRGGRVDRRAKVELFEQIRREYEHGGGTIRGISKKLGIHRRMVREAVLSAVPVERKTPVRV